MGLIQPTFVNCIKCGKTIACGCVIENICTDCRQQECVHAWCEVDGYRWCPTCMKTDYVPLDIPKMSGAVFYSPPNKLDEWMDPLMRPVCEKINRSGWAWTAESCQGHPDADRGGAWAGNTRPMLRLVTQSAGIGKMLAALMEAYGIEAREVKGIGERSELTGLTLYPSEARNPGWFEILVYINAANVYQRDCAMGVWRRFAEIVTRKET